MEKHKETSLCIKGVDGHAGAESIINYLSEHYDKYSLVSVQKESDESLSLTVEFASQKIAARVLLDLDGGEFFGSFISVSFSEVLGSTAAPLGDTNNSINSDQGSTNCLQSSLKRSLDAIEPCVEHNESKRKKLCASSTEPKGQGCDFSHDADSQLQQRLSSQKVDSLLPKEDPVGDQPDAEIRICEIFQCPHSGKYGFSYKAIQKNNINLFVISRITPGLPAASTGLKIGDRICQMNGELLKQKSPEDVLMLIHSTYEKLILHVKQMKILSRKKQLLEKDNNDISKSSDLSGNTISKETISSPLTSQPISNAEFKLLPTNTRIPTILSDAHSDKPQIDGNVTIPHCKLCQMYKYPEYQETFGFDISPESADGYFYIVNICNGSSAYHANLKKYDRILEVNRECMKGRPHTYVIAKIADCTTVITLLLADKDTVTYFTNQCMEINKKLSDIIYYRGLEKQKIPEVRLCVMDRDLSTGNFPFSIKEETWAWTKNRVSFVISSIESSLSSTKPHLHVQDKIIEINGEKLTKATLIGVQLKIDRCARQVTLLVADKATVQYYEDRGVKIHGKMENILLCHPAKDERKNKKSEDLLANDETQEGTSVEIGSALPDTFSHQVATDVGCAVLSTRALDKSCLQDGHSSSTEQHVDQLDSDPYSNDRMDISPVVDLSIEQQLVDVQVTDALPQCTGAATTLVTDALSQCSGATTALFTNALPQGTGATTAPFTNALSQCSGAITALFTNALPQGTGATTAPFTDALSQCTGAITAPFTDALSQCTGATTSGVTFEHYTTASVEPSTSAHFPVDITQQDEVRSYYANRLRFCRVYKGNVDSRIGIDLEEGGDESMGYPIVCGVDKWTPAYFAGIKEQDRIIMANNHHLLNVNLGTLKHYICNDTAVDFVVVDKWTLWGIINYMRSSAQHTYFNTVYEKPFSGMDVQQNSLVPRNSSNTSPVARLEDSHGIVEGAAGFYYEPSVTNSSYTPVQVKHGVEVLSPTFSENPVGDQIQCEQEGVVDNNEPLATSPGNYTAVQVRQEVEVLSPTFPENPVGDQIQCEVEGVVDNNEPFVTSPGNYTAVQVRQEGEVLSPTFSENPVGDEIQCELEGVVGSNDNEPLVKSDCNYTADQVKTEAEVLSPTLPEESAAKQTQCEQVRVINKGVNQEQAQPPVDLELTGQQLRDTTSPERETSCMAIYLKMLCNERTTKSGNAGINGCFNFHKAHILLHLIVDRRWQIEEAIDFTGINVEINSSLHDDLLLLQNDRRDVSDLFFLDSSRFIVVENADVLTENQKELISSTCHKHAKVLFISEAKLNKIKEEASGSSNMWLAVKTVLTGEMCSGTSAIMYNVNSEDIIRHINDLTSIAYRVDDNTDQEVKMDMVFKMTNIRDRLLRVMKINRSKPCVASSLPSCSDCLLSVAEILQMKKEKRPSLFSTRKLAAHLVIHQHYALDLIADVMEVDEDMLFTEVVKNQMLFATTNCSIDICYKHLLRGKTIPKLVHYTKGANGSAIKSILSDCNSHSILIYTQEDSECVSKIDYEEERRLNIHFKIWSAVKAVLMGQMCSGHAAMQYNVSKCYLERKLSFLVSRNAILLGTLQLQHFIPYDVHESCAARTVIPLTLSNYTGIQLKQLVDDATQEAINMLAVTGVTSKLLLGQIRPRDKQCSIPETSENVISKPSTCSTDIGKVTSSENSNKNDVGTKADGNVCGGSSNIFNASTSKAKKSVHELRLCILTKEPGRDGFGFKCKQPNAFSSGYHFVSMVYNNSPASKGGLKRFDVILEVNGIRHEIGRFAILRDMLQNCSNISLLVADTSTFRYYLKRGISLHNKTLPLKICTVPSKDREVERTDDEPTTYHAHLSNNQCEVQIQNKTSLSTELCEEIYGSFSYLPPIKGRRQEKKYQLIVSGISNVDIFLHFVMHKKRNIRLAAGRCDIKLNSAAMNDLVLEVENFQRLFRRDRNYCTHFKKGGGYVVITLNQDDTEENKNAVSKLFNKHFNVIYVSDKKIEAINKDVPNSGEESEAMFSGNLWLAVKSVLSGQMCTGVSALVHDVLPSHIVKHLIPLTAPKTTLKKLIDDVKEERCMHTCQRFKNNLRELLKDNCAQLTFVLEDNIYSSNCLLQLPKMKMMQGDRNENNLDVLATHLVIHYQLDKQKVADALGIDAKKVLIDKKLMERPMSTVNNGEDICFKHLSENNTNIPLLIRCGQAVYSPKLPLPDDIQATVDECISQNRPMVFYSTADRECSTAVDIRMASVYERNNLWSATESVLLGGMCSGYAAIHYNVVKDYVERKVIFIINRNTKILTRLHLEKCMPYTRDQVRTVASNQSCESGSASNKPGTLPGTAEEPDSELDSSIEVL